MEYSLEYTKLGHFYQTHTLHGTGRSAHSRQSGSPRPVALGVFDAPWPVEEQRLARVGLFDRLPRDFHRGTENKGGVRGCVCVCLRLVSSQQER